MNAPLNHTPPTDTLQRAASTCVIAYRRSLALDLCRQNLYLAAAVARDPNGVEALQDPPDGAVPKINQDPDAAHLLELIASQPQHTGRVLLHLAASLHYLYMADLLLDQLGGVSHEECASSGPGEGAPHQIHAHLVKRVRLTWQRCNSVIDEAEQESARAFELMQACAGACTVAPEMAQQLQAASNAAQDALSHVHRIASALEAYTEAVHDLDTHVKG